MRIRLQAWAASGIIGAHLFGCGADGQLQRQPAGNNPPSSGAAAPGAGAGTAEPGGTAPPTGTSADGNPLPQLPRTAPNAGRGAVSGSGTEPAPGAGTETGSGPFELAWQDDFDTLDMVRWQLMTHSWDTNLAQFSTTNTRIENGILSLLLTRDPTDTAKPFRGVELRSREAFTYGKVEARVRFAKGSGVVSALVCIYTPWPAADWNELDVEFLGRYADRVQFNTMVYTGPPVQPPAVQSVTPTQFPQLVTLPFDPSLDFHVVTIEWTPSDARFSIDGELKHAWSSEIARMNLPQNILATIWASSSADWAGPIAPESAPVSADYDWIRVYRWKG